MTRLKKSRKPGEIHKTKSVKTPKEANQIETKKSTKGKRPGSRNSLIQIQENAANRQASNKDQRLGSKTPIMLSPTPAVKATIQQPKAKMVTPVKPQDNEQKWAAELDQLEQDESLQSLLDRYDADETLNAHELAELNKKTARHAWLIDKLEIEIQDEDEALLEQWQNADLKKGDY